MADLDGNARTREGRGSPLVATPGRVFLTSVGVAVATCTVARVALSWSGRDSMVPSLLLPLACAVLAETALVVVLLRAEESRLARELRTARTGSPIVRQTIERRRGSLPLVARIFSTGLGGAAVRLADGDRSGASDALAAAWPWMRGGRLDGLRSVVDADLERADASPAALDRCIERLRAGRPLANRAAELYRLHVLVKSILARGDSDAADEVARDLVARTSDDERIYASWLRVWFDLDIDEQGEDDARWPALSDGDVRLAMLVARAHGADALVTKLEARLSSIARDDRQG